MTRLTFLRAVISTRLHAPKALRFLIDVVGCDNVLLGTDYSFPPADMAPLALLRAAGADFQHVVRATVFLADMNEFAAMNAVYARYVADPPPTRSTVQVAALPRNARVEIDVIAVLD